MRLGRFRLAAGRSRPYQVVSGPSGPLSGWESSDRRSTPRAASRSGTPRSMRRSRPVPTGASGSMGSSRASKRPAAPNSRTDPTSGSTQARSSATSMDPTRPRPESPRPGPRQGQGGSGMIATDKGNTAATTPCSLNRRARSCLAARRDKQEVAAGPLHSGLIRYEASA